MAPRALCPGPGRQASAAHHLEPGARPDFAKLHDGQLIRLTLGKDGQYIEHVGT